MHEKTRISFIYLPIIAVALIPAAVAGVAAETSVLWGALEPGPHAVGFRTIEHYDYSRTYRPEKDFFGDPLEGVSARPIQVCYWYPSVAIDGGAAMVYGEYSFPYPENSGFFDILSNLQNRDLGALFFVFGNNQPLAQNSMDLKMRAVRDAKEAEGSFPLIIYHGSRGGGYCENVVMCEYLASHGFVVAATHTLGTLAANPAAQGDDLESAVRDRELATALMRDLPVVDIDKIGLIGSTFGGLTALLHQMRHTGVDAIVTLQGNFLTDPGAELVENNAFFSPLRMQVPWLQLYADNPQQPIAMALVDSLKYAKLYTGRFQALRPNDFFSYTLIAATMAPDTARPFEAVSRGYNAVCRYTLEFFDAFLNGSEAGLAWLGNAPEANGFPSDFMSLTVTEPEAVPPTQLQFTSIIQTHGTDRARGICERFSLLDPVNPILPGGTFTQLGYQFLQQGRVTDALEMFRMGVTAYPTSANAWDSYGEACAANGEIELALSNYRKAQELLPVDSTLTPGFRQILETNIPPNIERLEQLLAEQPGEGD